MIRIQNIRMPLSYTEEDVREALLKRLSIPPECLQSWELRRRSVDARHKVTFLLTVDAKVEDEAQVLRQSLPDVRPVREETYTVTRLAGKARPVVIGFGPGGMFAALVLAMAGLSPLVLERGRPVEERAKHVERLRNEGILCPESNVQFGEGGAGTFSDGKLHTGIRDARIRFVLETFAACGAPSEILWQAKPHIGTDKLMTTVKTLRKRIESLGGEVLFGAKFCGFTEENGSLRSIQYEREGVRQEFFTPHAVLAIGHSARDTFALLLEKEIPMEPKPFSVGVRVEHWQEEINRALYGRAWRHPALGAGSYQLAVHLPNGRSLYTFCMCPGGEVIAAASEENHLAVNGMSPFARDGVNANSALLVGVTPEDFGSRHPLAGVAFQRKIEAAAFRAGGGGYKAPVIRLGDFLARRQSECFGAVKPTYLPGTAFASPEEYLPAFVCETLREGIPLLGKRLRGFASEDALLTGAETRSSSPVRILRDSAYHSTGLAGLYPCGEGAGYAGGITSAAVDGMHCAEAVITAMGGAAWSG